MSTRRSIRPVQRGERRPARANRSFTSRDPADAGVLPAHRPGLRTTELWSTLASVFAALIGLLTSEDRAVKLACVGALTCLGTVLGAVYIWSRVCMKSPGGRPERPLRL